MQRTFSKRHSYPRLSNYEGLLGDIPLRAPKVFMGIEVEAENVFKHTHPPSWKVVEDHSLKVEGIEFVTTPIRLQYLEIELNRMFMGIPTATFSSRTSIHVHINVRDMCLNNLFSFMLLYLVFEKNLYKFSGNRWNNNYCIPLYESEEHIISLIRKLIRKETSSFFWSKYAGINLNPIRGKVGESGCLGTIEFRHMIGNNNTEYIIQWCNLICCLKLASKSLSYETIIALINDNKTHRNLFISHIFKKFGHLIIDMPDYEEDIKKCNTRTKYYIHRALNNL